MTSMPQMPEPKGKLLITIVAYKKEIDYRVTESIQMALYPLAMQGWQSQLMIGGGSADVAGCRNTQLACTYMAKPITHMLFVDADVSWEPGSVERLVSHDVDLILGAYPRRQTDAGYAVRALPGEAHLVNPHSGNPDPNGIIEIAGGPAGFMLISRNCMEKMIKAYADRWYADPLVPGGKAWNLFEFAIRDHERYGEDLNFCWLFRQIGGKVWCDPNLNLHHHGDTTFSGNFAEHLRKGGRMGLFGKVLKMPLADSDKKIQKIPLA
jgi:hypothetical protein